MNFLKNIKIRSLPLSRKQLLSWVGTLLFCGLLLAAALFARPALAGRANGGELSLKAIANPTDLTPIPLPEFNLASTLEGISRIVQPQTTRPDPNAFEIRHYKVKKGDTVIGIAEQFGLKPSTIFFANLAVLGDDPHSLRPDQDLVILPMDGVYYQWHKDDALHTVADFYKVPIGDIINYPGNHLLKTDDLSAPTPDPASMDIAEGTWLIIPGGTRDYINSSSPFISRSDPAVARLMGPGYCGKIVDGAIGSGTFVWPTTEHWISGFDYSPETNHPAIDIAGHMGNPIFAADSGVVVYAGWNDRGYGNVTVLDHGNGFQTLYAHQSSINVTCGQSVAQGAVIGAMGSTGNSTGPHLHFEISIQGAKQNPHTYLPPP
jgi:murein DD-endopeptidase MepM/ murein hydrolase activator NlpD